MENIAIYLQLGGLALIGIGTLWLIIAAFTQKIWWGLGVLLLAPLVGLIFAVVHWKKGLLPVLLCVLGALTLVTPAVYSRLVPIDLGPREQLVQGKLRITLTGWDRDDYSILQSRKEVEELEMANPDVTDQTLEYLRDMDKLEYLDLSQSQVTDAGLEHLKGLTRLKVLFLDKPKITDTGVENYLKPMESLTKLSVTQTQVSEDAAKAWRKAQKGRKVMR